MRTGPLRIRWKVWIPILAVFLWMPAQAQEQSHADRDKFHADVAHALLEMHETLATIAGYHAKGSMPPDRDALHEKAAHGFKHALELFGTKPEMAHKDKAKFHADVAHALLEMHETLVTIAGYHAKGSMPPDRDALHEKAAHGFKHALHLFDMKRKWAMHLDRAKFHADVAHALLEMHETLATIAGYHAKGSMPPDRDALHEKAAHSFKHALELFGVKLSM